MTGKNKLSAFLSLQLEFLRAQGLPDQYVSQFSEIIHYLFGHLACKIIEFNRHNRKAIENRQNMESWLVAKDQLALYFNVKDLPPSLQTSLEIKDHHYEFLIPVKITFPVYELRLILLTPWVDIDDLQNLVSLSSILELKLHNHLLFQDWRDSKFESGSQSAFHCILHEIRNKLTAPMTYIQMNQKQITDPLLNELGALSAIQINEINEYSSNYLNLFSKEASRSHSKESASLEHAVTMAIAPLSLLIKKEKITLDKPDLSGIYLPLPPSLLRDIIFNIFKNAISALGVSTRKHKRIEIKLIKSPVKTGFSIIDNGIGISTRELRNIARAFTVFRPDKEGTGLGLNIVSKFVTACQGKITFASEKNKFFQVNIWFSHTSHMEK